MIRHQPKLIMSKEEKLIVILYIVLIDIHLLHADVGNLEFSGKNATIPQYILAIVDLHWSKVYAYLMRSRKQILQKMKLFYDEVKSKG